MKLTTGEKTFQVANMLIMLAMAFLFLYPFWYVLVQSFNVGLDAAKGGIYWWPRMFTLDNYSKLFSDDQIVNAYEVTILRTVIGTIGTMLVTSMVAYGLSRQELPGRKGIVLFVFITMLFGGGLIPFYLLLHDLDLLNRFAVYVVPSLFSVFTMVVMNTSFKSIPDSLIESAQMDGANYFRIFWQVVLPLSLPMLAALSLFTAVYHWNDWFTGAFFNSETRLEPLQTYLQRTLTTATYIQSAAQAGQSGSHQAKELSRLQQITPFSLRMATLIIATGPILCIYPFLQRYFVKGALIGSIKE